MTNMVEDKQREICIRFGSEFYKCDSNLKVGISRNIKEGVKPIHGLRIIPEGDTNGWYIWAGDWSDADDFFVPLHAIHLSEWVPQVLPYLGLSPGWRFLIAENYEDVWKDNELLDDRTADQPE
ncbi:hypothetical protein RPD76_04605 [Methylomonas sp. MV1]|uniref:immunity protein Imm33 domain-containing protein n=1 Tax=Methylomonas sp. MV1 TaxID=3073620 RepID=UPI0028A362B7|nr:hypothetical protein [Methylomonas sp. MV1]MDT4329175.1 hypothetical protein [Methylomonas sp. MV1]